MIEKRIAQLTERFGKQGMTRVLNTIFLHEHLNADDLIAGIKMKAGYKKALARGRVGRPDKIAEYVNAYEAKLTNRQKKGEIARARHNLCKTSFKEYIKRIGREETDWW